MINTCVKKVRFVLLTPFLSLVLVCCSSQNSPFAGGGENQMPERRGPTLGSYLPGEMITYDIKSLGVRAGQATLSYQGLKDLGGKKSVLIVFTARAANFYDEEKIYADSQTLYPVRVERDLNIWGKKEKITEEYNQAKGIITITKIVNNKTTTQTIEKAGPIDNIYCFIYRYRKTGQFKIGDSFLIQLPTRNITIDLVKTTKMKAAGKVFETYYMQSDPAKYRVWFDKSEKKIPLRINGAVGINDTAMIMTEYQETSK